MDLIINDVIMIDDVTTIISSTNQVAYNAQTMTKIKQEGFFVINNLGNKLFIKVIDCQCSFSISGGILVAIKTDNPLQIKNGILGCNIFTT